MKFQRKKSLKQKALEAPVKFKYHNKKKMRKSIKVDKLRWYDKFFLWLLDTKK